MSLSLSKSWERDTPTTGTLTVLNIAPKEVPALVSKDRPFKLEYSVNAGYGRGVPPPLISSGYINETSWSHEGGDTSLTFYLTELSKYLSNAAKEKIFKGPVKKGASAWKILETIRDSGQTFEFIPSEAAIRPILEKIIAEQDIPDPNKDLRSWIFSHILVRGNLTFYEANGAIVIRRLLYSGSNPRDLWGGGRVNLSFKTGLLSANIENSFNYQENIAVPRLKFRALFIPQIVPSVVVRMTGEEGALQESYKALEGDYGVTTTAISLNNKEGPFHVEGTAISLGWTLPRSGLSFARQITASQRSQQAP